MKLIQKIANEGSSNPFYARLWIGILQLRDQVLKFQFKINKIDGNRSKFDSLYKPVLNAMTISRNSMRTILNLLKDHKGKINENNEILSKNNTIKISENIHTPLHDELSKLLVNGVIAMKHTQEITKMFNVDIGCLFTKEINFKKGISRLKENGHNSLAEYLQRVRNLWSEGFIRTRVSLEHEGWVLPEVRYELGHNRKIILIEPKIDNIPLSNYSKIMVNRIISFIENVIVYTFKCCLHSPFIIVEIPETKRDPKDVKRFRITIKQLGLEEWALKYSESDFS